MSAVVAAVVVIALLGADVGVVYWISTRTGLYRWAQEQIGPPRRSTGVHARLHRLGAMCLCMVVIGIPVQGGVVIVAGIAAAVGAL